MPTTSSAPPPLIYVSALTTKSNPGASCKSVKENDGSLAESGYYWINLSVATMVYCDMDTDGGQYIMYCVSKNKNLFFIHNLFSKIRK